LNGKKRRSY
jgi:mitogen-activated protein kinase 15